MHMCVDGKLFAVAERVEIIVNVAGKEGLSEESELHLVFTDEGLIADLVENTALFNGTCAEVTRTMCAHFDDIVEGLE